MYCFYLYLHNLITACVVRCSDLLFYDIWIYYSDIWVSEIDVLVNVSYASTDVSNGQCNYYSFYSTFLMFDHCKFILGYMWYHF